ncbi:hypothetical protein PIROE2DRAFT_10858 [Piromyces sp. E2]|nr:hypothetical protein PIROE2DRAFT_10858 [Piromyces sp. E2]|eukprot:OUM62759.1 hypothetical protein PIROE2DRAFT_10858 [Piromyces sp. E2]
MKRFTFLTLLSSFIFLVGVRAAAISQLQTRTLDVFTKNNNSQSLKPVVVFIHGGAWVSGDKFEYQGIGSFLSNNNYVAVIPNYVLYPSGNIDDMVDDVYQSIVWTYENISLYGGDKDRIILSGHSAGAHLAALTAIKAALQLPNNENNLKPLPKLEKMVLLNGPYDFNDYGNDLGELTPLITTSQYGSPTQILKGYSDNSIRELSTTKINIFAVENDQLVPGSSSPNFIQQLKRVAPSIEVNYTYNQGNGYDHTTIMIGIILLRNSSVQNTFLDLMKQ